MHWVYYTGIPHSATSIIILIVHTDPVKIVGKTYPRLLVGCAGSAVSRDEVGDLYTTVTRYALRNTPPQVLYYIRIILYRDCIIIIIIHINNIAFSGRGKA